MRKGAFGENESEAGGRRETVYAERPPGLSCYGHLEGTALAPTHAAPFPRKWEASPF